mgnify:CR=1 FL=1
MIIAVSGVDCSGKSTQIARLVERLDSVGRTSEVRWYRPGYSDELDTLRALLRRNSGVLPPPGAGKAREQAFSRPWVRSAWIAVALLDTLWTYGLKLRCASWIGRLIICDRYVWDAVLDLHLRFPNQVSLDGFVAVLLRLVCPRPRVNVLLHLSADEALDRQAKKAEPFPDDRETFLKRHGIYDGWAEDGRFSVIDSERSIEEVHDEILSYLPGMTS